MSEDACKEWKPSEQYWIDRRVYGDNSEIIWNKTLFEQLGISIEEVHTEEGIYAALEKAKNADMTVNGEPVIPCNSRVDQDFHIKRLQKSREDSRVD